MDAINNILISDAFRIYQAGINHIRQLNHGKLPSNLRRFDVRFRLALGTTVQFNHDIAYTRTASTRRTYALLHHLNDLWFSWEGLIRLCQDHGSCSPGAPPVEPFKPGSPYHGALKTTNPEISRALISVVTTSAKRAEDTDAFITYLSQSDVVKAKLQRRLHVLQAKLTSGASGVQWQDALALSYAIRNTHVHGCDGARSGVRMSTTKIAVLEACIVALLQTNLTTAVEATASWPNPQNT
jgi:hypothetical protein